MPNDSASKTKHQRIKEAAEADLLTFIRLVAPERVLGQVHLDVLKWWTRPQAGSHQLLLLPRDHQKSVLLAYRVAWEITRNPQVTVLYISATSTLAEKQLYFIKTLLLSKRYRRYWPEMVNEDEGKREKWTNSEIIVDHPLRKESGTKDSTIFTAGLTTGITGQHFDIAALDDVVVPENAYTQEGRTKVALQYSLLASVETTGAREWVVGTRYHPNDLYGELIKTRYKVYSKEGEIVDIRNLYEVFERPVEDKGDGTGVFLWPKQQRLSDNRWFGFDANELSRKKAQYKDQAQYFAQYYNNPNDPTLARFDASAFQYYEPQFVHRVNGRWFFKSQPLNVFAAIDFAYSVSTTADYTSIVVVGVDPDNNYFVLDIDRFQTDRISEYFEHILRLHIKWSFRTLRAETTAAQKTIVEELKTHYIAKHGIVLSVDENKPTRRQGAKEERIAAILEPKYDQKQIWHFKGGLCAELEREIMERFPEHDDIKDALAACVEVCVPPRNVRTLEATTKARLPYHPRFGGVAHGI